MKKLPYRLVKLADDALLLRLYVEVCEKGYTVTLPERIRRIALRSVALYLQKPPTYFRQKVLPFPLYKKDNQTYMDTENIFVLKEYLRLLEAYNESAR
jgi:hypothetical protein